MISHLSGKIINKTEKAVIVQVNQIGYLVHCSSNLLGNLEENTEIELFIHSHIREDAFDLYGFENYKQLEFFKILLNINGIGPKVGLEILNIPTEQFKLAIISDDDKFISKTPGIGKKTAQRIILELKNKISTEELEIREHTNLSNRNVDEEIVEALQNLGYSKNQVLKTLEKLPENIIEEEDIIRFFLRNSS